MGSVPTNLQLALNQVQTGNPACEGRKAITILIDFSLGLTFSLDLSGAQAQLSWFKSIQTIYIDNSANANPFIITCGVTTQRISIPAGACAYMPVLQPDAPVLQFNTASAIKVKIQLLNFFIPPCVWNATNNGGSGGTVAVADAILDGTVIGGKVQVQQVPLTVQGLTDASGTIAVGGTAQSAIPANVSRQRWIISNTDLTATGEKLSFSFGSGGAGEIDLQPGATWDESNLTIVGDQVFVKAATLGHTFTCYYK